MNKKALSILMRARMKPNDRTNLSLSPIPLTVSNLPLPILFTPFNFASIFCADFNHILCVYYYFFKANRVYSVLEFALNLILVDLFLGLHECTTEPSESNAAAEFPPK